MPDTQVLPEPHRQTIDGSVLVVDDDDRVRQLLVRWLEASGCTVDQARNAEEALTKLERHGTHVVLCDAIPPHEALLELQRCAGTQFDAAAVAAFASLLQA